MTAESYSDIRHRLHERLGREPNDRIWEDLTREGYLAGTVADHDAGNPWEKVVAELRAHYLEREKNLAVRREVGPDANTLALSEILALEAAEFPEVQEFRREVLRRRLMSPNKVAPWVRRHAAREGRPTVWLEIPTDDDGQPLIGDRLPSGRSVRILSFPDANGDMASVPVRLGGVLDRLRLIAEGLRRHFPAWQEAQAVDFVLTGRSPLLPLARVRVDHGWPHQELRSIRIDVSPRLNPPEVAKIYRTARTQLLGEKHRDRPVGARAAAQAVFIAGQSEGVTWERARLVWNARYADWEYSHVRLFTRDCRQAYKRVTGSDLDWKGTRARREQ